MTGTRESILKDLRAAVSGFAWYVSRDTFDYATAHETLAKIVRYLDNLEDYDDNA